MTALHRSLWSAIGVATIALIGACTSSVADTPTSTPSSDTTQQTDSSSSNSSSSSDSNTTTQTSPTATPTESESLAGVEGATPTYAWEFSQVDTGTKPALAIETDGTPHIQYMLESQNGWVREARWDNGQWVVSTVAEGYFYGPGDIGIGPDNVPHISYHDHQASGFQPDLGDAVYARQQDGEWIVGPIQTSGHDGWDNRVFVDDQGDPHISAVDPKDFSGIGVKYYRFDGTEWQVERVGRLPITYAWGTSLAVATDGRPHIVFHNDTSRDLRYATRPPEGDEDDWELTAVDSSNRAGLFPDIALDANEDPHISYVQMDGTTAFVKHAVLRNSEWTLTTIDRLDAVALSTSLGDKGARNLTSIVIDATGNPIISYSDEAVMKIARYDGETWAVETVATADGNPLGQITSLRIDAEGILHLGYAVTTAVRPLAGEVWYAKGTPTEN